MEHEKRRHNKKSFAQKIMERNELLMQAHVKVDGMTIKQLRHFIASRGPNQSGPETIGATE